MSEKNSREAEEAGTTSGADQRPGGLKGVYRSPYTQIVMLGFVCFMTPGLFNALNGLGGAGQVTDTAAANSNVALYSCFAVMAFFAGTVNNKLGSRLTLFLGTLGYSLYIGSYLATNIHPLSSMSNFNVAAGAVLGICAGLLWDAQGSIMLSYATEQTKGIAIGIFWAIFNLGAVVGAAVALGQNISSEANSVTNGTYIGFIILTLIGACIPICMADPNTMYRVDGSKVSVPRNPSWKAEFLSLGVALRTDPLILLLFPLFFASNFFYAWQFNEYNFALFNIRTRALNSLCYWFAQIFGSLMIGAMLDTPRLTRRTRAFVGWVVLLCMVMGVHGWAYHYQKGYTRESTTSPAWLARKIDFNDPGFAAYIWLYIFMGLLDAMWQTAAYWFMGAMSNDPAKLAHFTGFYKSLQSAGGAVSWRIDAVGLPFMNVFGATWGLLIGGLLLALPMLYLRVKDHTTIEDEALVRMDNEGHVHSASEKAIAE